MMRLRPASALVTLYMLTSAATAHAECAWFCGSPGARLSLVLVFGHCLTTNPEKEEQRTLARTTD
jgi:hypothetical protein